MHMLRCDCCLADVGKLMCLNPMRLLLYRLFVLAVMSKCVWAAASHGKCLKTRKRNIQGIKDAKLIFRILPGGASASMMHPDLPSPSVSSVKANKKRNGSFRTAK